MVVRMTIQTGRWRVSGRRLQEMEALQWDAHKKISNVVSPILHALRLRTGFSRCIAT
jgi:hypothetical protein